MQIPQEEQAPSFLNALTIIMLSMITFVAVFVTDLGVINSVGGGSIAVLMCFVFPYVMYKKAIEDLGYTASKGQHLEVKLVLLLTILGCVIGVVGVGTELVLGVA